MTSQPRRPIPVAARVTVTVVVGLCFAFLALLAGRVGPLEVHALPYQPPPPQEPVARPGPELQMTLEQQEDVPGSGSGEWLWWVGVVLTSVIAIALATWLIRALLRGLRRPARAAVGESAAPVGPTVWNRLGETAPVDLGDPRTFRPREAADDIIASWEAVERACAAANWQRRDSSTPTEFLDDMAASLGNPAFPGPVATFAPGDPVESGSPGRDSGQALYRHPSPSAAEMLLHFYHRARFDTSALAPGAATAAREAARALLAVWDTAKWEVTPTAARLGVAGSPRTAQPTEGPGR